MAADDLATQGVMGSHYQQGKASLTLLLNWFDKGVW